VNLDDTWLEIVAAVRPRLAPLEARQLDPATADWAASVAVPDASTDPWHMSGPVVVAYGPGVEDGADTMALAALDGWSDSVPSRRHATTAAFGFNAPKSRAPQAVLVAVPPDISQRLDNVGLLEVILETRELVQARAPRQIVEPTLPHATSTAFVSAERLATPRRVATMTDPLYLILEPGSTDTNEDLRARVADPVWFLTRQWQLGELQGEDTSTPVVVTSSPRHVPITYDRTRPDLDPSVVPAEALLEAEPGDWWTIGRRVRLGRAAAPLIDASTRARFRIGPLPEPYQNLSEEIDGRAVFVAGLLAGHAIWAQVPSPPPDRWSSSELDYSASFEAGNTALRALNHNGGDVDWFSVDGDPKALPTTRASPAAPSRQVIPGRLDYPGAPNPRWWTLENQAVDIGGVVLVVLTSRRCCCWMSR
jgi:hypothetical protein